MKSIILTILFLSLHQIVFSQINGNDCTCNDIFEKDLRTKFSSYNSQNSKELLLKYFISNQETRQKMKNNASLEGSVSTIIKKLPIDIGVSGSSNKSKSKYYFLYKEIIENNYVSDENLQSLSVSTIPDLAFDSYNKCLSLCKNVSNRDGITLRNVSTQENLVVLELRFKSTPSGGKVSIKDAIYSSGTVVGVKKLKKNIELLDGQTLYEHIKLRQHEDLTVSISFNEGVTPASLSFTNSKIKRSTDTPIGTIVASILNYNQFLEVNGLKYVGDINKTIWVPCDGRNIGTTKGTYGAHTGGKVPDLRGLFLRGANNMGNTNSTIPNATQENLNPDNTAVGKIQLDGIRSHRHNYRATATGSNWLKVHNFSNGSYGNEKDGNNSTNQTETNIGFSGETRPKNMTVYYYIKIR